MKRAQFHHRDKLTARRLGRRSPRGESCRSRALARFREKRLLDSVDRAQCTQLSRVDHPDPTNRTTTRLLVVSESISTSSTVGLTGGGLRIATLGVAEGEPDGACKIRARHDTRRRRRYTLRRLRVGRQSIRERSAFPTFCFHCGQPNPVLHVTDYRRVHIIFDILSLLGSTRIGYKSAR